MWANLVTPERSFVVELTCEGLASTIDEKRGLERVRRALNSILVSLAPDRIVSARVSGDRFILAIDQRTNRDLKDLLRGIQSDLLSALSGANLSPRISLEIDSLNESGARDADASLVRQMAVQSEGRRLASMVN